MAVSLRNESKSIDWISINELLNELGGKTTDYD